MGEPPCGSRPLPFGTEKILRGIVFEQMNFKELYHTGCPRERNRASKGNISFFPSICRAIYRAYFDQSFIPAAIQAISMCIRWQQPPWMSRPAGITQKGHVGVVLEGGVAGAQPLHKGGPKARPPIMTLGLKTGRL